jgi:NAD(P)-dependent dehydrogenase (short-subunit alcohol dehydrogenase family)
MAMTTAQRLGGKCAVVFGAGGSIGAAVAKQFACEGAEVFLAGRTGANVKLVEKEIAAAGGQVRAEVVDASDEAAVGNYVESVVRQSGRLDIAFNATGPRVSEYANGTPAVDLSVDLFIVPVNTVLKSQYITARAAARQMINQGSGVIMFLTGSPARPHLPGVTGIGAAFGAVENLTRTLAIELGPAGVRVVCLRTAANPDSRTIQDTRDLIAHLTGVTADHEQFASSMAQNTMLKVNPLTEDTARAAAFLASDSARMMTGTVLNSSAGAVWD